MLRVVLLSVNGPLFCLLLLSSFVSYGQKCPTWKSSSDPLHERTTGVQLYLGGPTVVTAFDVSDLLYRDHEPVFRPLRIHAGLGITGFDLGTVYEFPTRSRHLCFYTGVDFAYNSGRTTLDFDRMRAMVLAPMGCRYVFRSGFSLGAELMPNSSKELNYCWAGLKIGFFIRED